MSKSTGFTEADVPDQSGKCFVVTGANTGVGYEITRVLAQRGARVLLACRDEVKAQEAMTGISRSLWDVSVAMTGIDPGLSPAL
jgi:NAD(P)-dependent dehydrogenase (short-subunit alcohol dehydrogenase family)